MGARTQVKIVGEYDYPPVYLYSHWGAGGPTINDVRDALAREQRWGDAEYLARIVFCQMVKGQEETETGFGIGTVMHSDIQEMIVLDLESQNIYYQENYDISDLKKMDEGNYEGCSKRSFKEFISTVDQP